MAFGARRRPKDPSKGAPTSPNEPSLPYVIERPIATARLPWPPLRHQAVEVSYQWKVEAHEEMRRALINLSLRLELYVRALIQQREVWDLIHRSSTPHPPLIHRSSTPHPPLIHPSPTPHPPLIHPSSYGPDPAPTQQREVCAIGPGFSPEDRINEMRAKLLTYYGAAC